MYNNYIMHLCGMGATMIHLLPGSLKKSSGIRVNIKMIKETIIAQDLCESFWHVWTIVKVESNIYDWL